MTVQWQPPGGQVVRRKEAPMPKLGREAAAWMTGKIIDEGGVRVEVLGQPSIEERKRAKVGRVPLPNKSTPLHSNSRLRARLAREAETMVPGWCARGVCVAGC